MGQQYFSKLDAFDSFVSHAKLAPLDVRPVSTTPSSPTAGKERRRKVILVDDLPHVNAPEQRRRLAAALGAPLPIYLGSLRCILCPAFCSSLQEMQGSLTHLEKSASSFLDGESTGLITTIKATRLCQHS